ncbi:MAG: hypothetical protein RL226_537, partial [Bacteroidota bacterium]
MLNDLLVIDASSVLAGPSVGTFFAELGARVIKIENSRFGGDVTRTWKTTGEDLSSPVSAYYASVNFGKEVHLLDLSQPSSQEQLYQWLKEADVFIENFKYGDRTKLGVDPALIKSRFPRLVHCHLSGFADDHERVAYDVVLQAEGGYMSMNGQPEGPPTKMPLAFIDMLAAHQMKQGILLALYQRERTGDGNYIETSLEEAGLAGLTNQAANYLMVGKVAGRLGSKHPNIAPYGDVFTCADGVDVVTAVGSDRHFQALCRLLGTPAVSEDDRFSTNAQRVRHRNELIEALTPGFQGVSSATLLDQCHDE